MHSLGRSAPAFAPRRLVALLATAALCSAATPAALAGPIATLDVVEASSQLTPAAGPAESLSGTLDVELGALPVPSPGTTLDVTGLSLVASGGAAIGLDPGFANPGLGVVNVAGAFLIPTLFLRLDDGLTTLDVAITDITGQVFFRAGGSRVGRIVVDPFEILAPGGPVGVTLVAVPEPSGLAMLALGLTLLMRRPRRSKETAR